MRNPCIRNWQEKPNIPQQPVIYCTFPPWNKTYYTLAACPVRVFTSLFLLGDTGSYTSLKILQHLTVILQKQSPPFLWKTLQLEYKVLYIPHILIKYVQVILPGFTKPKQNYKTDWLVVGLRSAWSSLTCDWESSLPSTVMSWQHSQLQEAALWWGNSSTDCLI